MLRSQYDVLMRYEGKARELLWLRIFAGSKQFRNVAAIDHLSGNGTTPSISMQYRLVTVRVLDKNGGEGYQTIHHMLCPFLQEHFRKNQ